MKKLMKVMLTVVMLAVLALALLPMIAAASELYTRSTKALSATAGTGVWTNATPYSAIELKRIWCIGNSDPTNTVTIQRVSSDGTYTQAVGSITCSGNAGNTASFTAAYLKYGDMLLFSSSITTGSTMMVEYLLQQP